MENLFERMSIRPKLWERSTEPFWDDEHISKGMLEAHLNPTLDAASRRKDTIDKSINWITSVIPPKCKILDLGCGPGLYCKQFSELGFDVTGVDFSKRSINFAKDNDKLTKYIYKNYLEISYINEFDVIVMIYCDYAALTSDERQILLSKIKLALKPNGIFIFDVFTDIHNKDQTEQNVWSVHKNGGFWSPEPYINLEATCFYEKRTVSVSRNFIVTATEMKEYLIWDTTYNLQRLQDEVSTSGLEVEAVYDDICGNVYTGNSETLCMILINRQ